MKHITDLIHYLLQYFSQIYDRDEMLVPGLLCSKITSARAAAQRLCDLWQKHNREDSDDSDGNDSDATTPEEEIPQPLHSVVRTLMERYSPQVSSFARGGLLNSSVQDFAQRYNQRSTSRRVESTFSVLTSVSRTRTHIGIQRMSLITRGIVNKTELTLSDWSDKLKLARALNRPGSVLKQVYGRPKMEVSWLKRHGLKDHTHDAMHNAAAVKYNVFAAAERALKVSKELKASKKKRNPAAGVLVINEDCKDFTRLYDAERKGDKGEESELEIEEAEAELAVYGEPVIQLISLEQCNGCEGEFELSAMWQYNGDLMCHTCVDICTKINRGEKSGLTDTDDDGSGSDEGSDEEDKSESESGSGGTTVDSREVEPADAANDPESDVQLPAVGVTVSWHVDPSRNYFKKKGTVVISTEDAGTHKDYDAQQGRKTKLKQKHVAVTLYKCIEIGTPTGWLYVEVGDFVWTDVETDDGTRSRQIVEISKLFETSNQEYRFEYSWMYNKEQAEEQLPWYDVPTDFDEKLELISGNRHRIGDVAVIRDKVKVLDKYQQSRSKCDSLKSYYFRRVVDELMGSIRNSRKKS